VQGATEFHHQITDTRLPQAEPVLHDAAALDTAVDMLDPQPPLVQRLVRHGRLPHERLPQSELNSHGDVRFRAYANKGLRTPAIPVKMSP
jgi:hypothetical protein